MLRVIVAFAVIAGLIALGVNYFTNEETKKGPTTVHVSVPDPVGGSNNGGSGGGIYVP